MPWSVGDHTRAHARSTHEHIQHAHTHTQTHVHSPISSRTVRRGVLSLRVCSYQSGCSTGAEGGWVGGWAQMSTCERWRMVWAGASWHVPARGSSTGGALEDPHPNRMARAAVDGRRCRPPLECPLLPGRTPWALWWPSCMPAAAPGVRWAAIVQVLCVLRVRGAFVAAPTVAVRDSLLGALL